MLALWKVIAYDLCTFLSFNYRIRARKTQTWIKGFHTRPYKVYIGLHHEMEQHEVSLPQVITQSEEEEEWRQ